MAKGEEGLITQSSELLLPRFLVMMYKVVRSSRLYEPIVKHLALGLDCKTCHTNP